MTSARKMDQFFDFQNLQMEMPLFLCGMHLCDMDLAYFRFRNVDLTGAEFFRCELTACNFEFCTLREARFVGCSMSRALMRNTLCVRTKFSVCDLTRANFARVPVDDRATDDEGDEAESAGRVHRRTVIRKTLFEDCVMEGVKLETALLQHNTFRRCTGIEMDETEME